MWSKVRGLELYRPLRFVRAMRLRHAHGLSAELSDSLGLLDRPRSEHRAYAFEAARATFIGAVPPLPLRSDEEDKVRFAALMQASGLPTPQTLGIVGRREDTDASWTGPIIDSAESLATFVRERAHLDAICKPATGGGGGTFCRSAWWMA